MTGFLLGLVLSQASTIFGQPPLPDAVLAQHRGGIRLPNGIDATWSIDTRTAINGAVVLQTVVRVDQGAPQVSVYAPPQGQSVPLGPQQTTGGNGGEPRVTYDMRTGLTVTSQGRSVPVQVSSGAASASGQPLGGLVQLAPGQAVTTDNGVVQAASGVAGVELRGADIQVLHLTGNALGSAIVNSGSDRAIDTQTTLSIDLRSAGPDVLGSAMLRVESAVLDALAGRF